MYGSGRGASVVVLRVERQPVVVDHDPGSAALNDRSLLGKIKRHDRDILDGDVMPDVKLGPVGERKDTNGFAGVNPSIEEIP